MSHEQGRARQPAEHRHIDRWRKASTGVGGASTGGGDPRSGGFAGGGPAPGPPASASAPVAHVAGVPTSLIWQQVLPDAGESHRPELAVRVPPWTGAGRRWWSVTGLAIV